MGLIENRTVVGGLAVVLSLLLIALSLAFVAVDRSHLGEAIPTALKGDTRVQTTSVGSLEFKSENTMEDVLWLARVIYSETKRPEEQELVAWVVRNRVETGYRGAKTYRDVTLDPWQFSAFNRNSPKRRHYINLPIESNARGFQVAVAIAHDVITAPSYERPFAVTTRHFYSEISMVGRRSPNWARGHRPVALDRPIDPRRFRFYANIL